MDEIEIIDEFKIVDEIEFFDEITRNYKVKTQNPKGYVRMHRTADKKEMPISAMDNRHLENFINLIISKMNDIKESAMYEVGDTQDMFHRELNGVKKMTREEAVDAISALMYLLEPYLSELVIRGNNSYILNISEKLENILGRKKITGTNLLR